MSKILQTQINQNQELARKQALDKMGVDLDTYLTLKNSIFPGAKDESIMLALAYCRSANLDILQKPVHIVPTSVKNANTGQFEFRDIVMPGIALYRIQASRSGTYAGKSEPDYGPDITEVIGNVTVTYPQWCKITVKKLVGNNICDFSAREFWKENYASKKDGAPNTMWCKRAYAQLAKCAEAQALRMAWPELLGGVPTAEEMEGKSMDSEGAVDPCNETLINDTELTILRGKIEEAGVEEINICSHLNIEGIEMMTQKSFSDILRMLQTKITKAQKTANLDINKAFEKDINNGN